MEIKPADTLAPAAAKGILSVCTLVAEVIAGRFPVWVTLKLCVPPDCPARLVSPMPLTPRLWATLPSQYLTWLV